MAAGYDNGDVKLFDLRTQSMRWETNVKNGVTGLEFDRNDIEMNKVRCVIRHTAYGIRRKASHIPGRTEHALDQLDPIIYLPL